MSKLTFDEINSIKKEFLKTESSINFTKACWNLKTQLAEMEIGQQILFKVDNAYYSLYSFYEKVTDDTWRYIYGSKDETYDDRIIKQENIVSDIGNSFLSDTLISSIPYNVKKECVVTETINNLLEMFDEDDEDYLNDEDYLDDVIINEIADELNIETDYDEDIDEYTASYNDLELHYSDSYESDIIGVTINGDDIDVTNKCPEGTSVGEDNFIINIPVDWSLSKIVKTIKEIDNNFKNNVYKI